MKKILVYFIIAIVVFGAGYYLAPKFIGARVSPSSFSVSSDSLDIASGDTSGVTLKHIIGVNTDIDTATDPEDLWDYGGAYVFPTASSTLYMTSSSSADTVIKIQVKGLDSSYDEKTATAWLNGTSSIRIGEGWIRVFEAKNISTTTDLTGDIWIATSSLTTGDDGLEPTNKAGNTVAKILSGNQISKLCIYTIPNNKTGYLSRVYINLYSTAATRLKIQIRSNDNANILGTFVDDVFYIDSAGDSNNVYEFPVPIKYTEKTDIVLRVLESSADNAIVSGGMEIVVIDD